MDVIEDLHMPLIRNGFQTELFEPYHRRQVELDDATTRCLSGGSTAQVGDVVATLTGASLSPSAISRMHYSLEGESKGWKQRILKSHYI